MLAVGPEARADFAVEHLRPDLDPIAHMGAQVVNEHGSVNFNDLNTRQVDGAKSFYGSVFGWQTLGKVVVPPFDAPWVRMTIITDPQGATFTASQFVPENRDLAT